jgi:hypothetical protein
MAFSYLYDRDAALTDTCMNIWLLVCLITCFIAELVAVIMVMNNNERSLCNVNSVFNYAQVWLYGCQQCFVLQTTYLLLP